jgi:2,5-diketo-D-gluconate reductase B
MGDGKVVGTEVIRDIGARHGKNEAQVVLRRLIQQDGVVALTKTVSEDRASGNLEVFDFELTPDEMAAIHAPVRTAPRQP